jgi:glycosyltransferase involved in cell wall biosynthesis
MRDAVVVMDGDMQHPPELLEEMYRIWSEGTADVVEAVRTGRQGDSGLRALGSRVFNRTYTLLTGYDLSHATDFKLLDRRVVDEFLKLGETRAFYRGMIAWLGFRHQAIAFENAPAARSGSAWNLASLAQYATTALTSFTAAPLHLVTMLGVFTLVASILLGIQTLYMYFSGAAAVGFSTVIVVQLFGNSIVMLSLGVIGEYLGSVYQESKRRPRFIVSETAGVDRD